MQGDHGWVKPRVDGQKARCGGPSLCLVCQNEQRQISIHQAELKQMAEAQPRKFKLEVKLAGPSGEPEFCDISGVNEFTTQQLEDLILVRLTDASEDRVANLLDTLGEAAFKAGKTAVVVSVPARATVELYAVEIPAELKGV